ncbi:MAG: carboxypeptidase-like regulatory domain-containing protein, partial [Proteiniphilum sp.]|nr:carboxypeptidase-like regulatory domain-containing protein [Proteiniphilum sp.]
MMKDNWLKGFMLSLFFLMITLPSLLAQGSTTVEGKVVDDQSEAMIGVSVLEKGTSNGTVTDLNGNYQLSIREGATLVFSYIGYITQEHAVSGGTLNVTMDEDTRTLDELVVVGYGVQKKSSLTGAVSSVKSEDME